MPWRQHIPRLCLSHAGSACVGRRGCVLSPTGSTSGLSKYCNWQHTFLHTVKHLRIVSYRIVSRYFVWYRIVSIVFSDGCIVPSLFKTTIRMNSQQSTATYLNHKFFVSQSSVEIIFKWGGKLFRCFVANLVGTDMANFIRISQVSHGAILCVVWQWTISFIMSHHITWKKQKQSSSRSLYIREQRE